MTVRISLLGGFEVRVDGVPVPPHAWSRRHAAALVKLLALSADRRLHREQVVDALWPGSPWDAAAPRLHKAAHYARRALGGEPGAVVLRNEVVALLPDTEVTVDVPELERAARQAFAAGTAEAAAAVLDTYDGTLLPDDVYEPWTEETRETVRVLHLDLLRQAGRWEDLLAEEPADEQAHLALARASADRGRRPRRPAPVRADGPGAAPGAGHHAVPGGAGAARDPRAAARRAGRAAAGHPARRPPRRRRPDPGAPGTGRGRPRQHPAVHRTARRGQVRGARPGRRAGRPAGLADRAGHRVRGRGALAVLAGAGGARRALPAAPGPARRAGRRLPAGDRAGAVRAGRDLERRVRPPAAVRGRGRAGAAGRDRARAAAGGRRHPRGRRRVAAAAALPVPGRRHRAGGPGAGAS